MCVISIRLTDKQKDKHQEEKRLGEAAKEMTASKRSKGKYSQPFR